MSATELSPTPADLLAEAGRELGEVSEGERDAVVAATAPQVTIPDPEHVIGDRACPVCEGIGRVPFDIPQSPRYCACPDCKGTGNVLTGSFDQDCAMITCERCQGRGFVDKQSGQLPTEVNNPNGKPPFEGMSWNDDAGEWRWP